MEDTVNHPIYYSESCNCLYLKYVLHMKGQMPLNILLAILSIQCAFEKYDKFFFNVEENSVRAFFVVVVFGFSPHKDEFCNISSQQHTDSSDILYIMRSGNEALRHCSCHILQHKTPRKKSCRPHGILVFSTPSSSTQSLGILQQWLKSRT